MKVQLFAAAALAAFAAAGAASAADVEIKNAVARVVVIPEARSDVKWELHPGRANLPAIDARRGLDGRLILDGHVSPPFFHGCSRTGPFHGPWLNVTQPRHDVRVRVAGRGIVDLSDAPLIVLHTPKSVHVAAGEAVFGNVGRSDNVQLSLAGCGDWTVGNVAGKLSVEIAGSGDVRAGSAGELTAKIAGSGNVDADNAGPIEASIAGSGDVRVQRSTGGIRAHIMGSGDVIVADGRAPTLDAQIAGSGGVRFGGVADQVDAHIAGSGDVRVKSVRGGVHKAVAGSGSVIVGG